MMTQVDVSIVIPIFRGEDIVNELWERLKNTMTRVGRSFEVVLIDDGSPDDTWLKIERLADVDERVKGIRLSRNFGQHPAIAAGYDSAQGDVIILMDGDLEDQPESIPDLLHAMTDQIDIVYTIKEGERGGAIHRCTSWAFHKAFSNITATNVPNNVGTMRAFKRNVLAAIQQYKEHNILFGPLMFFIGFPSVFVKIKRDSRRGRQSSYSFFKRLELAARTLGSYTNLPHRMFLWSGTLALGAALIYSSIIIVQYLFFRVQLPPGLTVIALLLLTFIGLMMMSLGVIGSYVFRVYQEVLNRPRYLVQRTINVPEASLIGNLNRDCEHEFRT